MGQVFRLFSTPVFKNDVDKELCDRTLKEVYKLKTSGQGFEYQTSWSSRDDLQNLPQFKELETTILKNVKDVFDYLTLKRDEEYITCMWANVNKIGQQHPYHIHANSILSGVIYLKAPLGSGKTYFSDPRPSAKVLSFNYEDPIAEWMSSNDWGHDADVGTMLIFPSWLPHGVDYSAFDLEKDRVTLSFNIMIKGSVTHSTRKVEFK